MLGTREPEVYGSETLADVVKRCEELAKTLGLAVEFFQSNIEGEIVGKIQEAKDKYNGLIINAGAYTHTSVAIYDALLLLKIPVVEIHISNIWKREEFRHHSYISPAATGIICGFGTKVYDFALNAIVSL